MCHPLPPSLSDASQCPLRDGEGGERERGEIGGRGGGGRGRGRGEEREGVGSSRWCLLIDEFLQSFRLLSLLLNALFLPLSLLRLSHLRLRHRVENRE